MLFCPVALAGCCSRPTLSRSAYPSRCCTIGSIRLYRTARFGYSARPSFGLGMMRRPHHWRPNTDDVAALRIETHIFDSFIFLLSSIFTVQFHLTCPDFLTMRSIPWAYYAHSINNSLVVRLTRLNCLYTSRRFKYDQTYKGRESKGKTICFFTGRGQREKIFLLSFSAFDV